MISMVMPIIWRRSGLGWTAGDMRRLTSAPGRIHDSRSLSLFNQQPVLINELSSLLRRTLFRPKSWRIHRLLFVLLGAVALTAFYTGISGMLGMEVTFFMDKKKKKILTLVTWISPNSPAYSWI